jgi:hypothetical protein
LANVLYPKAKEKFLSGLIDLTTHDIKVVLVDTADYTYSASHEFLSDVASGARVATSANLGSKTVTSGVFDAADPTFTSVTGDQSEAMIIYRDTGSAATSPLIAYIDTATGLPVTPAGVNIPVVWDNGASKIFAL